MQAVRLSRVSVYLRATHITRYGSRRHKTHVPHGRAPARMLGVKSVRSDERGSAGADEFSHAHARHERHDKTREAFAPFESRNWPTYAGRFDYNLSVYESIKDAHPTHRLWSRCVCVCVYVHVSAYALIIGGRARTNARRHHAKAVCRRRRRTCCRF